MKKLLKHFRPIRGSCWSERSIEGQTLGAYPELAAGDPHYWLEHLDRKGRDVHVSDRDFVEPSFGFRVMIRGC